jgi:hypothetical protein
MFFVRKKKIELQMCVPQTCEKKMSGNEDRSKTEIKALRQKTEALQKEVKQWKTRYMKAANVANRSYDECENCFSWKEKGELRACMVCHTFLCEICAQRKSMCENEDHVYCDEAECFGVTNDNGLCQECVGHEDSETQEENDGADEDEKE